MFQKYLRDKQSSEGGLSGPNPIQCSLDIGLEEPV